MANAAVILWAESEAEAGDFIELFGNQAMFSIKRAYVAKKSRGKRDVGSRYQGGVYFPYDLGRQVTLDKEVIAPDFVTRLVQWCSPDIILTTESEALITIETTYHVLTFNNVAQRIPRQIRSAAMGVPSVIFQKVDHSLATELAWFVETFVKATRIYQVPCLALVFDESEHSAARNQLIDLVNARVNHTATFGTIVAQIQSQMQRHSANYDVHTLLYDKRGRPRTWIRLDQETVTVIIGVRDNCALTGIAGYGCQANATDRARFRDQLKFRSAGKKGCVWLSKGTGGMDPYAGLVKMAEILLCYDEDSRRVKKLVSYFAKLPADFWWFEKNQNEIYYKLVREFSDEVKYAKGYS